MNVKNWPSKYFAIAYHNIDEEIPEGSRRAVRLAHYSFILLTVALSYNFFFAASAMFFVRGKFSAWLMAAIYFFTVRRDTQKKIEKQMGGRGGEVEGGEGKRRCEGVHAWRQLLVFKLHWDVLKISPSQSLSVT